ncbi:PucR family transcriptional regulator [Paenibacillus sambharensis]|uniref:PucR family transcriptional regulator n=1 Tax=Paenibacillus sambharensis TaxID=1803190 RepID=A0A2W1LUI9_9BACL|nr:helix-turn-helix domain-containing protein [Paenibacillus sambharensis]PZD95157.1 PucR family transcriptional regulator [Paenibacillus sambharensis]
MNASWRNQLESLFPHTFSTKTVKKSEWLKDLEESALPEQMENQALEMGTPYRTKNGTVRFLVSKKPEQIEYVELTDVITHREQQLLSIIIRQAALEHKPEGGKPAAEKERIALELGRWVKEQLESGKRTNPVPIDYTSSRLEHEMIPFLIVREQGTAHSEHEGLEKLLQSFFEEEVMIIPLQEQEWLILGPASILREDMAESRMDEEGETADDMLTGICSGLHGMLANEWVGECHVAVDYPIIPAESIVDTAATLRETISLGRKYHIGENIHFPWMLSLERLLNGIPEEQRHRYIELVVNRSDLLLEPEIITTLETFFSMNCNVSDTAKKLYIHRNTLLYRLDKLKQDTGLDVRLFRDAVLVKIILLLYKVTKRK